MAGLIQLLAWQWRAYWRKLLRGGTAARSNLLVLGLIALAGLARYVTFLRETAGAVSKGQTGLLNLTVAGLVLLCVLPVWDSASLALGAREMVRFPLAPVTRFGLRILSRFIAPLSWILVLGCLAVFWPVAKLPHGAMACAACALLLLAAFLAGAAAADFAGTAKGARWVTPLWLLLGAVAGVAWFAGVRTLPPLPSHLILLAGNGSVLALLGCALLALAGSVAAVLALPWMLAHSPRGESTRQTRSAKRLTLLRRELRLLAKLVEIRTAWAICAALCVYLSTAGNPEPDALRVMLGVLAFFTMAAPMNNFAQDGVAGLDRFLLWPVSGARILQAKNLAFALAFASPVVPLAALAFWRFGWREGFGDLLEAASLLLVLLSWGNITSVRHPESSASGGYILDQVIGMAAAAVPTAVAVGVLRGAQSLAPITLFGVVVVCGLVYWASIRWSSRFFEQKHETMRQGLA